MRRTIDAANRGVRKNSILQTCSIADAAWEEFQNELVSFIDGGVGQVELAGQVPVLLRVGSYAVRVGERCLAERENFGYYPITCKEAVRKEETSPKLPYYC